MQLQPKIKRLTPSPSEPYDEDWKIPHSFRLETPKNLVRIWLKTKQESTGSRPEYPTYAMINQAEQVINKIGYEKAARALYNMATPFSKYYQYPYSIDKAVEGYEEVKQLMEDRRRGREMRTYQGFIGPVGMRKLNKEQ